MRTCPRSSGRSCASGIILVKFWLSLSDDEQEKRFHDAHRRTPASSGSSSPMDIEARARWVDYAEAKDEMFAFSDIHEAPVVRRRRRPQAHGAG